MGYLGWSKCLEGAGSVLYIYTSSFWAHRSSVGVEVSWFELRIE